MTFSKAGHCDPKGGGPLWGPCCSPYGACGNSTEHCCADCVNFGEFAPNKYETFVKFSKLKIKMCILSAADVEKMKPNGWIDFRPDQAIRKNKIKRNTYLDNIDYLKLDQAFAPAECDAWTLVKGVPKVKSDK